MSPVAAAGGRRSSAWLVLVIPARAPPSGEAPPAFWCRLVARRQLRDGLAAHELLLAIQLAQQSLLLLEFLRCRGDLVGDDGEEVEGREPGLEGLVAGIHLLVSHALVLHVREQERSQALRFVPRDVRHVAELACEAVRLAEQHPDAVQDALGLVRCDRHAADGAEAVDEFQQGLWHGRGQACIAQVALQVGVELQHRAGREAPQLCLTASERRTQLLVLLVQQAETHDLPRDVADVQLRVRSRDAGVGHTGRRGSPLRALDFGMEGGHADGGPAALVDRVESPHAHVPPGALVGRAFDAVRLERVQERARG
mmetsp:Transcript_88485/g.263923  ORF Transcript_88485/g.263923 Transcript_88485/m.263923 type:complete len:312 (+) Transcript_88485:335-1270(+)